MIDHIQKTEGAEKIEKKQDTRGEETAYVVQG